MEEIITKLALTPEQAEALQGLVEDLELEIVHSNAVMRRCS